MIWRGRSVLPCLPKRNTGAEGAPGALFHETICSGRRDWDVSKNRKVRGIRSGEMPSKQKEQHKDRASARQEESRGFQGYGRRWEKLRNRKERGDNQGRKQTRQSEAKQSKAKQYSVLRSIIVETNEGKGERRGQTGLFFFSFFFSSTLLSSIAFPPPPPAAQSLNRAWPG